jgi:magnesium chelatase family protein
MPSKVFSSAIIGLDAQLIEVEADVSYGLPIFNIVGLPDKSVQESKERVGSAIKSSLLKSPQHQPVRVLISLAPADLKKEGALYDLPIALSYLSASKQIKFDFANKMFVGELALDGKLRPVKGALSFALACAKNNFSEIILPKENAQEASLIKGIKAIGVESLKEAILYIEGKINIAPAEIKIETILQNPEYPIDLGFVKGQEYAKRALEISAAGSHNILFSGPPGTGKTLLAKSLISILPPLSFEESLEVTKIYSVAGFLPQDKPLISTRPFRSPHHTTSEAALIGGGNPPRAGEITLAHRGVLFLDEFPEFHRDALESLRQPIEEGKVMVLRARHALDMPARFMLVAAANPCPCGYLNDPMKKCTCMPSQISMYRRKLSGPLMDRMDLFIDVPALKYEKLTSPDEENSSLKIREKVQKARATQEERFKHEGILTNSEMGIPQIKKYCQIDGKSQDLLRKYVDSGKISARGYHRTLRLARTIADLDFSETISFDHVAESIMYRVKES